MKLHYLFLLFLTLGLVQCDSTPLTLGFEYQELEADTQTEITLKKKSGEYYLFTTSEETTCTITLNNLSTDMDLTLGTYKEETELQKLTILATSKEPGVVDEIIQFKVLSPHTSYLIEVWNYSTSTGSSTLSLTLQ